VTGDVFRQPAFLDIVAVAADSDGSVVRVEYFANGTRLGETTARPHRWSWLTPPQGIHTLSATAIDNAGLATATPAASVTILPLQLTLPVQAIVDGRFNIAFLATTGQRYRIESSTNLVDWITAGTVDAENGGVDFSEPVGSEMRFYRSVPDR
jgi:YD repeat-containing protein